jgi:pimeloyl-ACP methyl ester carboxylesterase
MTEFAPATVAVPVSGGTLTVGVWNDSPDAPAVLAIHGITANHRCWPLLADHLPGVRLIAPDLRGRGRSRDLGGPYGLEQHARDLVAVLDHLGLASVAVVAHSMGAFVAVLLAARFPDRVSSLTLVDGGLPLDPPGRSEPAGEAGGPSASDGTAVLGPAARRLSMTFASVEEYRDFWREHPAFRDHWSAAVEAYVDYDLHGDAPELRPSGDLAAVGADVAELYGGEAYRQALASVRQPTTFLRAPRGLLDEPEALYRPERPGEEPTISGMRVVEVDDVNHYTIVLAEPGARRVAHAVSDALHAPSVAAPAAIAHPGKA